MNWRRGIMAGAACVVLVAGESEGGRLFFFGARRPVRSRSIVSSHVVQLSHARSIKGQLLELADRRDRAIQSERRSAQEHLEQMELAAALGIAYDPRSRIASFAASPYGFGYAPAGAPVPASRLANTVSGLAAQPYWPYVAAPPAYPSSQTGYPHWQPAAAPEKAAAALEVDARPTAAEEILKRRCADCHAPGGTGFDKLLLFNGDGALANELPVNKIIKSAISLDGSRPAMPPEPHEPLSPQEQETLAVWILERLAEN